MANKKPTETKKALRLCKVGATNCHSLSCMCVLICVLAFRLRSCKYFRNLSTFYSCPFLILCCCFLYSPASSITHTSPASTPFFPLSALSRFAKVCVCQGSKEERFSDPRSYIPRGGPLQSTSTATTNAKEDKGAHEVTASRLTHSDEHLSISLFVRSYFAPIRFHWVAFAVAREGDRTHLPFLHSLLVYLCAIPPHAHTPLFNGIPEFLLFFLSFFVVFPFFSPLGY